MLGNAASGSFFEAESIDRKALIPLSFQTLLGQYKKMRHSNEAVNGLCRAFKSWLRDRIGNRSHRFSGNLTLIPGHFS